MSLLRHRQFPFTGVVPHQGNRRYVMPNKPGGGGPAPPVPALIIQDTFTDIDTTLLTAHTPDLNTPGNPWVFFTNTTEITNNAANGVGATGASAIDAETPDVLVKLDYIGVPLSNGRLTIRRSGSDRFDVRMVTTSEFEMLEVNPGSVVRDTMTVAVQGGPIRMEFEAKGNVYEGRLYDNTGTLIATLNYTGASSLSGATEHGFTVDAGRSADNFEVIA